MSVVKARQCISVDGFSAGPNQTLDDPMGSGGMALHDWTDDSGVLDEFAGPGIGAYVMGRNMFGPGRGGWDLSWTGWWGDDPPYHAPVFVLTHHPREPLAMQGGTTFNFVTDGIESAVEQAQKAAGEKNVLVAGGASAVRQSIVAELLDELTLHFVPLTLGGGERLLEGVGARKLDQLDAIVRPGVTHVKYRIRR